MHLQELKAKSPADLLAYAEDLEVENASTLRKQDMMFAILKQLADNEVAIYGSGVLEVLSDGQRIWHHLGRAALTMRKFDDTFADAYIRRIGKAALWSPGAYQIESVGSSLFARIDGDHFDILGLPLLPLLSILHEHGLRPLETV